MDGSDETVNYTVCTFTMKSKAVNATSMSAKSKKSKSPKKNGKKSSTIIATSKK